MASVANAVGAVSVQDADDPNDEAVANVTAVQAYDGKTKAAEQSADLEYSVPFRIIMIM